MANSETYGRTSYFRVIEGKEAEFIEFVSKLSGEGEYEMIVDAAVDLDKLPKGEWRTDPRGFAIIDCDSLTSWSEDTDEPVDEWERLVEDFLRPGCGIIFTTAYREKMRYVGGEVCAASKSLSGEVTYRSVDTLQWCQELLLEWAGEQIEATEPTY
jgi:hypothetical protein